MATSIPNHESQFRRLIPASDPPGNDNDHPCLVVLSDWSQRPRQELIDQIEEIFRHSDERVLVPTVLIVDDLGSPLADHEGLLSDLTRAGGIVLVPNSQDEIQTIQTNPLIFAATQLAAM
jgi:hypothetical protein